MIEVLIDVGVKKVIVFFIDKVLSLINFYGVIKFIVDKFFIIGNYYVVVYFMCFVVVCYGNVMGL